MILKLMAFTGAIVGHGRIASMTATTRSKKFSTCLVLDAWGAAIVHRWGINGPDWVRRRNGSPTDPSNLGNGHTRGYFLFGK